MPGVPVSCDIEVFKVQSADQEVLECHSQLKEIVEYQDDENIQVCNGDYSQDTSYVELS